VTLYCERLGPGLLAEPLNAASNVAFFFAAWAAWSLAERSRSPHPGNAVLVCLIVTIGIGSTLFHTFATPWARVMDIVPIALFQIAYLWIYGRRVMKIQSAYVAVFLAVFVVAAWGGRQFPHLLNGSLAYAPAAVLGVALGLYHLRTQRERRLDLLTAGAALLVAIFFRTIDRAVCAVFPPGTHFVWHLLIPVVAYLYVRALLPVRASAPPAA
jgi:hypothetical protein